MDETRMPMPRPDSAAPRGAARGDGDAVDAVDALTLVRAIRDDFALRSEGLAPEDLLALIRREAASLRDEATRSGAGRTAA